MAKSGLIPFLALRTEFGYQLKLEESPGNRYARNTKTPSELVQQAYFRLSVETLEEGKKPSNPIHGADMILSEEELRAVYLALKEWAGIKGY